MNLLEPLYTYLIQAWANIPSNYQEVPKEGPVSNPDTTFIHINN